KSGSQSAAAAAKPILKGLTVTTEEYLVVGTLQPAGILVFDLHAGGPPLWLCWPQQIYFAPFDMACAPDGGVWILDAGFASGEANVWHLDATFRILDCSGESVDLLSEYSHDFYASSLNSSPTNSSNPSLAQERFFSGLSLNIGSPVIAQNPVAIEALSAKTFMVLNTTIDENASVIHYFVDGQLIDSVALDEQVIGGLLLEPSLHAHDFAFVPGINENNLAIVGDLYLAAIEGTQSYKFSLRATASKLSLVMQPVLLPMRTYSGKALIASGVAAFYDFDNRWLPLAEQPRHNYQSEGLLSGIIKDGEQPDCVWHRIIVDACIPTGTALVFESRTANSRETLSEAVWQTEPPLYLRAEGSELPFYDPYQAELINADVTGSWDVLLQNAVGRFIELRLRMLGNKHSTPRIRACRIYYPRFSYLHRYLPAIYRDDSNSASFLDRFLANVEGLFTSIEDKIAQAQLLFDTRTSPAEFLDWLAGWLGAFVDPAWDDQRKRLFIDNAILLFTWRGTLLGLQTLLRLSIEPCPDQRIFEPLHQVDANADQKKRAFTSTIRIVENFLTRRDPGITLNVYDAALSQTSLESGGVSTQWQPALGAGVLHQKYQSFLTQTYAGNIAQLNLAWYTHYSGFSEIAFSALIPGAVGAASEFVKPCKDYANERRDWQHFARDFIGFTYAEVNAKDGWRYQEFLHRRYRHIAKFNAAHSLKGVFEYESFDDIPLPSKIPENKKALFDWVEFVSLALPIAQQAHSFTVLLPTVLGDLPDVLEVQRARVADIVEREKPAHTSFEVKFFWAMFQVGSARLGMDTTIGNGGRFVALVLGQNFLGQSFLQESHPWSVGHRSIVGRGRLASSLEWRV
ncbi:MAG: phage tail-like protein, partial [Lentisphaeria bacterium]